MWAGAAIGAPARADATDAHGGATASRSRSDGVTLLRYRERTDDATTDRDSAPPGDRRGHPGSTPGCVDGHTEADHRHVEYPDGAYARWGEESKTLLLMPGGPGNFAPGGVELWMMLRPFRRLVDEGYTVWVRHAQAGHAAGTHHRGHGRRLRRVHRLGAWWQGRRRTRDVVRRVHRLPSGGRRPIASGVSSSRSPGMRSASVASGSTTRSRSASAKVAGRSRQGDVRGLLPAGACSRVRSALFGEVMGRLGFRGGHPEFASDVIVQGKPKWRSTLGLSCPRSVSRCCSSAVSGLHVS